MTKSDTGRLPNASAAAVSMRTDELDYELPAELIATRPVEPRDAARMLVVRRVGNDWTIEHRHVRDLPEHLTPADLLVFNVSRVLPARLLGKRAGTGGRAEGLFLEELSVGIWKVMLRSNGRLRVGDRIELGSEGPGPRALGPGREAARTRVVLTLAERDEALWVGRIDPPKPAAELLDAVGLTPLPPYIVKARGEAAFADEADRQWYQTIYAATEHMGSVAAPTAGLHFTSELLARLESKGVGRAEVVLHVGPGTFKPVTAESLADHVMHEEQFTIPPGTVERIREHQRGADNARIVAVGTTTVRALESAVDRLFPHDAAGVRACGEPIEGRTRLLIAPPCSFRVVDALLTNFHLPRSTLLALVAAMIGRERWREVYGEAVRQRYRFYSYGDAMLILP
jgi:S-adenosylmethionine:tRNA ribosyltransferase-isomerase